MARFGVVDSGFNASRGPALRRHDIQHGEPGMVDLSGGLDELFNPGQRLVDLGRSAEERRARRDDRCDIEVALVGGPPKRGAQIGQFGREPAVRLPLSRAIPQSQNVGFFSSEVMGLRGANLFRRTARHELLLAELPNGLQHRKSRAPRGSVRDQQRFAYQRVEYIEDGVIVQMVRSSYRTS